MLNIIMQIVKISFLFGGLFALAALPAFICAVIAVWNMERLMPFLFGEEVGGGINVDAHDEDIEL